MPDTAPYRDPDPNHRLLLYADDTELVDELSEMSSDFLLAGGAVVLLATGGHLAAVERRVGTSFMETASAQGRYQGLDADRIRMSLAQAPDPVAAFEAGVQEAMERVTAGAEPVLIFGEVVAGMWCDGQITTVIGMEHLGTRLGSSPGVAVVCGYPDHTVLASTASAEAIGGLHAGIDALPVPMEDQGAEGGARRSVMSFGASPAACRSARRFVRAALASAGAQTLGPVAELVCGELASNAVRHARSAFTVEVETTPGGVRLAVADGTALPGRREILPAEPDHGLGLVAALSRAWGASSAGEGKVVWAEMPRTSPD